MRLKAGLNAYSSATHAASTPRASTLAVCVTGLVVVDTGTYWSGFGQAVILALIQLGGLGFMTSATLLWLLLGQRISLHQRVLLREAPGGVTLGGVPVLVWRIIVFTLAAEAVGAAFLSLRFLSEMEPARALWWGVFHAISAFNNAGFDLTGGYRSLVPYNHDPLVLLTVASLFMVGGLSYMVLADLATRRHFGRWALDTKLVVVTTVCLVAGGTLGVLWAEQANSATLGGMEIGQRVLNAFFHGVTPRTAGFNSIDVGAMTEAGLLITIALMFIGGASASTAGGIKVQTFTLLLFAIISTARGLEEVQAFGRRAPPGHLLRALTVALLSVAVVFTVAIALNVAERVAYLRTLFEAVSAFGTVGLSTGMTPDTTPAGRMLLIVTMFIGRLGPLTLALALVAHTRRVPYRWPVEAVKIG
jgi:trk system potassium uptake protein TrkH